MKRLYEVNEIHQELARKCLAMWWVCARCGMRTQPGFVGLRAHTYTVHGPRIKSLGEPAEEQTWMDSSSTESKSRLRAVSSSPTADSPET